MGIYCILYIWVYNKEYYRSHNWKKNVFIVYCMSVTSMFAVGANGLMKCQPMGYEI